MHKNYFLEIITERPDLFAAILRFNGIAQTHDAQRTPAFLTKLYTYLSDENLAALWGCGPAKKHLQLLTPSPTELFWDFSEESRCLALLEQDDRDAIAIFYGACLHAPEITRTILGKDIAKLREVLSPRAYSYVLQRGQYQIPSGRSAFADRHEKMPLPERVLLHGAEALGIIAAAWPQTLQNRIVTKTPSDMPISPDLQRGIWFDMKKIMLREVVPAWAPCFA